MRIIFRKTIPPLQSFFQSWRWGECVS